MAEGFVDNLLDALGGDEETGPDTTRLQGLLEYTLLWMEEGAEDPESKIFPLWEGMRGRIREAHRDLQGSFEGRRAQLNPVLVQMIERNLQAYDAVDEVLTEFLEAMSEEALEMLEQAAEELKASTNALVELSRSIRPLCPRCGSMGTEDLCPQCQVDRLLPDPTFVHEDLQTAKVSDEFMAVYNVYTGIIEGKQGLAALEAALQPLEFSLLEAQAVAEQALEEDPDNKSQEEILNMVELTLEGVNRMLSVRENRDTKELNQGWMEVFKGALGLNRALAMLVRPQAS